MRKLQRHFTGSSSSYLIRMTETDGVTESACHIKYLMSDDRKMTFQLITTRLNLFYSF